MSGLTRDQRARAYRLAQRGYGWEDALEKIEGSKRHRDEMRDIFLGRQRLRSTPIDVLLREARERPLTLRNRQAFSISNRKVPITLAPVSILRDEK